MSTILTSTGVQFPNSTTQTSAGVSTSSRPLFRGTFSAGEPYPPYSNDTGAYAELIPYSQIDTVGHSFGVYPQIDTHSGFSDYLLPSTYPGLAFSYTVQVAGFYHISGMGNVYAQWNGTATDLSGRFRYVDIYLTVNRIKITGNAFGAAYEDYGILSHYGVCTEKIWHCDVGDKIELRVKSYKVDGGANYPPTVYLNSLCGYYVRSRT